MFDPIKLLLFLKDQGFDVHYMDQNKLGRDQAEVIVGNRAVWKGVLSGRSSHHPDILIRVNKHEFDPKAEKESRYHGIQTIDIEYNPDHV